MSNKKLEVEPEDHCNAAMRALTILQRPVGRAIFSMSIQNAERKTQRRKKTKASAGGRV